MNVLIVDDDRFVVASLTKGLNWNKLGFTNIYTAYNIIDAKTIITENSVDLLLSDIDMPLGSGLELLSWIRDNHNDMPVIFLTNYADFNYAQKALALKSFHYFLKPIEYDKLTKIIQDATLFLTQHNIQSQKNCENFWHSYLQEFSMPLSHPIYLMPKQFLYTTGHYGEDSLKGVLPLGHFGEDPFHHISAMVNIAFA